MVTKQRADTFATCMAFGVGAMIATLTAARISGGHVNPAASVAFALDGRLRWRLVPVYLVAQYAGAFLAALALMLNYSEAISALDGGAHSAFGAANSTGAIFATYPARWVSLWGSVLDQVIGTATLLFALSALADRNNLGVEPKHQPVMVALVVGFTCIAFSPNCAAIFNPARDLAPRLVTHLFGYSQPSVWAPLQGLYWLLTGVIAPHFGAILGVFSYKLTIGSACERLEASSHYDVNRSMTDDSLGDAICDMASKQVSPSGQQAKFTFHSSGQQRPAHHHSQPTGETNYGAARRS